MRPLGRIVLGVASAWPLAWFVAVMASRWGEGRSSSTDPTLSELIADPGWLVSAATLVLIVALTGFYCWHIRQLAVTRHDRRLWTVIVVFGHVLALPVYWHRFWWRGDAPTRGAGRRTSPSPAPTQPGRLACLPGPVRLLLGVPALLPSTGILLTVVYAVFFAPDGGSDAGGPWAYALGAVIFGNLALLPIMVALFVWDAVKGRGVAPDDRKVWVAFLLLANIVATGCYWWLRIWRRPT